MSRINYETLRDRLHEETGAGKRSIGTSFSIGFKKIKDPKNAIYEIREEEVHEYISVTGGRVPEKYYRVNAKGLNSEQEEQEEVRDIFSFSYEHQGETITKIKVTAPKRREEIPFGEDITVFFRDIEELEWYE